MFRRRNTSKTDTEKFCTSCKRIRKCKFSYKKEMWSKDIRGKKYRYERKYFTGECGRVWRSSTCPECVSKQRKEAVKINKSI